MHRRSAVSRVIAAYAAVLVIAGGYLHVQARPQDAARPQAGASQTGASQIGRPSSATPASSDPAAAVLNKYCVTCHNSRLKTAGLALDGLDVEHVAGGEEIWEK